MKVLYGQELVNTLRSHADRVKNRLWVVVPYIGGGEALRKILGKKWNNSPDISVKLLTDISVPGCINGETLKIFYHRGQIRSLAGLHAKIYIIDDRCLLTSANLTASAFSKRYETGMWLDKSEFRDVVNIFNAWWRLADKPSQDDFKSAFQNRGGKESGVSVGTKLDSIWQLPKDPGRLLTDLSNRFLDYDRLVEEFNDFGTKYSKVQRIWPDQPLNFEIDGLFNYLYHIHPNTPSRPYGEKENSPRSLSPARQLAEIKKWARAYKDYNRRIKRESDGEDIDFRINNSKVIRKLLSPRKIHLLSKEEVKTVLLKTSSIASDHRNEAMIFRKNDLSNIKGALNRLVNGKDTLSKRMSYCKQIKNIGPSTMNELIGYYKPKEYPLINKNSRAGLRFFGYSIEPY